MHAMRNRLPAWPQAIGQSTPAPSGQKKSPPPSLLRETGKYLAATYSHRTCRPNTIGAAAFHFRVRNGTGWFHHALATRGQPRSIGAGSLMVGGLAGSPSYCLAAGHNRSLTSAWSFQIYFNQPQFVHFEPCAVAWEASDSERNQARRMISTSKLHILLRFHFWPINVVVFHDPSGKTHLGRSLALRCFQRLSRPHLATRPCC